VGRAVGADESGTVTDGVGLGGAAATGPLYQRIPAAMQAVPNAARSAGMRRCWSPSRKLDTMRES